LWVGTSGQGLCRFDKASGSCRTFRHKNGDPSSLSNDTVSSLLIDRDGMLWIGTGDGLNKFDPMTQRFIAYRDETSPNPGSQIWSMAQDQGGNFWLGTQGSGLLRFDRKTEQLRAFGGVTTLSNPYVSTVYADRANRLWAGTFNGLDRVDPLNGRRIARYAEENGLASTKVSCILEDAHGDLWLSTNKGISKFNLQTVAFENFSVADGVPGDLTAYSACVKNADGEMFFGGFAGATRFRPEEVSKDSSAPPVALTAFDLFGAPVPVGPGSPLERVIGYTNELRLTHDQNSFSFQFSALSFRNPSTNRYRYMLEGLDRSWHEVGSDRRYATYTTLPAGVYRFRLQGATIRGPWSEPGLTLGITITPAWWATWWFRTLCAFAALLSIMALYFLRVRQLRQRFAVQLEARESERVRVARELHDTLLQGFQGMMFRLQAVRQLLPERVGEASSTLDCALDVGDQAIYEGRVAIQNLRCLTPDDHDLTTALGTLGVELGAGIEATSPSHPEYRVVVEGRPRELAAILRDDIYRIIREAVRNAYQHANAKLIETEITFGERELRVRVRDDGRGMDPQILMSGQRSGHWGLPGMRERSESFGGQLDVWSETDAGTEIELRISAHIAYARPPLSSSRRIRSLLEHYIIRLRPKSRASTDHAPGPNIANAKSVTETSHRV
jgi:signal transduction histidine kinase/streptogramin lyase